MSEQSARWWLDSWWEEPEYQSEAGVSIEEIRGRVNALKLIFNEDWTQSALDAKQQNAVLAILFGGKGLWPFENLMWLGRIARAISAAKNCRLPLRELTDAKSKSALFELEAASWFIEQGWDTEFLKPRNDERQADMKIVRDNLASAVECKRFGPEQWEEWASELSVEIMRRVHMHVTPETPSFDILFEPRLSDVLFGDESMRRGVTENLVQAIVDAVRVATSSKSAKTVYLPGVGQIVLKPDRPKSQRGIGGIEVSMQAKLRRIITNGILEAAQQLRSEEPGVVAVSSDFTPPKELVDIVLGGVNRADSTRLESVAVVAIQGAMGSPSVIWSNPLLQHCAVTAELVHTLHSYFGSEPSRTLNET
jgi:hypothetical protein